MKNTTYRFFNYVCAMIFCLALLFNASIAHAQSLQPIPPLTALVVDQTNTLSAGEIAQLDAKLKAFEKTKGSQIGILMVPTTAPEDIFSYSQRAAETYKLGRKGVGDGVLIVVAKNDRKMHVYVMRNLEGAIPDAYAKRIINEQMQPAFRANQFAAGLDAATTQIEKLIDGEQLPPPISQNTLQNQNAEGDIWSTLLMLTLAASFIGSGIAKSTSRWLVAPFASLAAGFVAHNISSIIGAAVVVALIVGLAIMIFGKHYAQLATQRTNSPFGRPQSRRNTDIFWGGGFGGGGFGGGGGGFGGGGGWGGSGGGGDAGGGGASGGW